MADSRRVLSGDRSGVLQAYLGWVEPKEDCPVLAPNYALDGACWSSSLRGLHGGESGVERLVGVALVRRDDGWWADALKLRADDEVRKD